MPGARSVVLGCGARLGAVSLIACLGALVLTLMPAFATAQPVPVAGTTILRIVAAGRDIGIETLVRTETADGWRIEATLRYEAPVSVSSDHVVFEYSKAWRSRRYEFDGTVRGTRQHLVTTVEAGKATTIGRSGEAAEQTLTSPISADAVILPNIFAAYEALAAIAPQAAKGTRLHAFVPPQAELSVEVIAAGNERILTTAGVVTARHATFTFTRQGVAPLNVELWAESTGQLLRLMVASQFVEAVRQDVPSATARVVVPPRARDEDVTIPAEGFSLAGTLSRPAPASGNRPPAGGRPPGAKPGAGRETPLPAVVLLAGSGVVDRNATVFGTPIFAQIASALADRGLMVLRYDKRGGGQSGGRMESATLEDYAADARAAVKFLRRRRDVDPKRIALVGHSEGGLVALQMAADDDKIAALALMACPSTPGTELNLEQLAHQLDQMGLSPEERAAKVALQKRIQAAVLTERGWEGIPEDLRRRAETPWFKSFLAFNPARAAAEIRSPVLLLQGEKDTQVFPSHAERLEAAFRKGGNRQVDRRLLGGDNHLFIPAKSGEVEEYVTLPHDLDPAMLDVLSDWLRGHLLPTH